MENVGRVNIQEVARQAGVSIKTVSRVINDRPDVAPETRQRVQEVILNLDYHPNVIAQGLRGKKANTIALAYLHYQSSALFADPFMGNIISGIIDSITPAGYFMLTYPVPETPEAVQSFKRLLNSQRIDGLILINLFREDPLIEIIAAANIPTVYMGLSEVHTPHSVAVTADYAAGTHMAMEYLFSKGHTRIAHISGDPKYTSAWERISAYQEFMHSHDLPIYPGWVQGGGWSRDEGRSATEAILACPDHPSAIIAATDILAIGAIDVVRERGLCVPKDIAIVGFDDIFMADDLCVPLTTVRTRYIDFGHTAATKLMALIENPDQASDTVVIPIKLIVRESA